MGNYKNTELSNIVYYCLEEGKYIIEKWKDIPNYEGIYQASSLGRIKSLERKRTAANNSIANVRERILKQGENKYIFVVLMTEGKLKTINVHKIIAICFLNHKPCGHKFVINHKDHDRFNNNFLNLEIITNRENTNKKHIKKQSNYTGVFKVKGAKSIKYASSICINGKRIHLGTFDTEKEASIAYENKLQAIT